MDFLRKTGRTQYTRNEEIRRWTSTLYDNRIWESNRKVNLKKGRQEVGNTIKKQDHKT